jgi:hypothetical protein
MVQPPLDELYYTWLYGQVGSVNITHPSRTYWALFKLLFKKEFVWIIPNDDNRAEDGKALRAEFLEQERIGEVEEDWMRYGCSMLELLIALARRMEFEAEHTAEYWFHYLLGNAGLDWHSDTRINEPAVNEIIDRIIWRTYASDGFGGLFCLERPREDQRRVEIWDQMCAWLIEKGYF